MGFAAQQPFTEDNRTGLLYTVAVHRQREGLHLYLMTMYLSPATARIHGSWLSTKFIDVDVSSGMGEYNPFHPFKTLK